MLRRHVAWILAFLFLCGGIACAEQSIKTPAQLNAQGMTVGISQGSAAELVVRELLPKARIEYFTDKPSAILAVAQGKIDAFIYDAVQLEYAIAKSGSGVHLLEERLEIPVEIAVGLSPVSKIPDLEGRINRFLGEIRADGTLDDMRRRWVLEGDETMPDIPMPESPSLHLTVGTSGTVPPYSYYVGTELNGFDIELGRRFAAWLGADVNFKVYDYGAIVPAANVGDVDCVMANLNITPERRETLPFSDTIYQEQLGVLVRDDAMPVGAYASIAELNGKRIGVQTGTSFDAMVKDNMPDSQIFYFNNKADLVAALTGDKVDAFVVDEPVAQVLLREDDRLAYLPEYLDNYEFSAVFAKGDDGQALCGQFNAFLAQLPEGTLEALAEKWFGDDEAAKTMPDLSELTAENGTLRVATEAGYMPFEYVQDGAVVGYDMELAAMFCAYAGYDLEIVDMNFDGILPAVQQGKCELGLAGINVTPERAESVLFSDPYFAGGTVLVIMKGGAGAAVTYLDFNGRRGGVITGSFHDTVIAGALPEATVSQFNNYSDMIAALKADKIDFFLVSVEAARSMTESDDSIVALPGPVQVLDIGAMFARSERGDALKAQMDEFIEAKRADGTLDEIHAFWSDPANESAVVDMSGLTGENGTLQFATSGTKVPVSFMANGQIAGTDPDIAVRFCREYGYGIEIHVVDTAGIIPGIVSGMYDFSLSDMVITDERKESVNFSVPYRDTELLLVTRKEEAVAAQNEAQSVSLWESISTSFTKTFLREDRWRLFVEGVLTTLLITVLTILFGTLLGFGLYMLCRNGNPFANGVTRFCLWLVQGMPMVVLLMLLYYVVFGSLAISGVVVAVIGFTLTFGSAVFGLLKMGVGAVDAGQYEAAYALGYSNARTFFRIILPQALPHVLPAYRGEIVGLIKATAIVGYIAVQDLTKMGDIVRSRTYEAFFPLIAITIIYFALEGLIGFVVSRVSLNVNPKRRKPDDILKGVKTDDQN